MNTQTAVQDTDPAAAGLPAAVCGPGGDDDWWRSSLRWWHVVFAGIAAVLAAVYAAEQAPVTAFVLLGVLVAWYGFVGVPALRRSEAWLGTVYLAGAYALFAAAASVHLASFLLLIALYPQTFALYDRFASAVLAATVLSAVVALVITAEGGWTRDAALSGLLNGALNLGGSVLLGGFIARIVREMERRAELIRQLEHTRAELAEANHAAGVLAERERLAREIHDTLAQGFTSILVLVQAADAAVDSDPVATRHRLGLAERTARDNLAEARALVAALAPVDLQSATLPEAVRRLADRVAEELGLRADVEVAGAPRSLSPNAQVVLLRSAQEALANVRKHAAARSVRIRLDYTGPTTSVEVCDDGRGFDHSRPDGYGLQGMRARVEQVGGVVEVDSAVGRGTTVRVMVP
jgi:signal transduction histidine kinase